MIPPVTVTWWRRAWHRATSLTGTRASALVEAAVALPILVLVLMATIDLGRIFYASMAVTQAVRTGVQYGAQSNGNAMDDAGMEAAATAAASDITGFVPTATHFCTCYNGSTESAVSCSATCATQLRIYTNVTGIKTFTTLIAFPGVPSSIVITRTATMRAQ